MRLNQIKQLENKALVESFVARIERVYNPTDPTEGQIKAGIHKQGILVGEGEERMTITLNVKSIHMDKDCEGNTFAFKSTKNEKGELQGMAVNRWTAANGEQRMGVDVWGQTSFQMVAEDTPTAHPQTEQKPAQDTLPAAQKLPAGDMPKDPKNAIYNYFGFYRYVYDIVQERMEGSGANSADIKDATTHYLIGLQQRGELKDSIHGWFAHNLKSEELKVVDLKLKEGEDEETPDNSAAPSEEVSSDDSERPEGGDESSEPESGETVEGESKTPWREVKDSQGKVISEMDRDDLIDLCIKLIPFNESDHPVIAAGFDAAMRSRAAMELSFADIYDVYEVLLNQDHDLTAIADAYKVIDTQYRNNTEQACRAILSDQKTFKQMVMNHEPQPEAV